MKKIVIGRSTQKKELKEALISDKPEMIALVGRRRVGKTYLVSQFYADHLDFEIIMFTFLSLERQLGLLSIDILYINN